MSRISRNLSIILRSERLIARHRVDVAGRRAAMFGAAGIFGAMALVMLDAAAYLALAARIEPALAALIVAVVNVLLAGVLVAIANSTNADREVESIGEVRDMAMADLEAELDDAATEIRDLAANLRKVTRDPFSAAGLSLIAPILGLILKNLKK